MPPKEQKPSKKAVIAKKERVIEDSTFGLKNKNKSKKVQDFVKRVETTVKNSNGGADAAKAKDAKKEQQIAKELQEEEMRILFNEGISNQFGKKKSTAKSTAEQMGISEASKEVAKILDGFSSDSDSDEEDLQFNEIFVEEENTVIEVFREKTIEDIIEEQRAKLAADGKTGTPVTAESFAIWRQAKLAKRQADAEARMKLEQTKKKGGKGLSVLTGKELFNYNASLFVDDDAAIDQAEEAEMNAETRVLEKEKEDLERLEQEKAQSEQQRLVEIQRIEHEEMLRRDEERRLMAALPDRATFLLGGVVVNRIVFDVDEKEDLDPLPDEEAASQDQKQEQEQEHDEGGSDAAGEGSTGDK